MRQSQGSLAYIERRREGWVEILTQWNEGWRAFSLIGGHKLATETFRHCQAREITEELGLLEGDLISAPGRPMVRLEYVARSESTGIDTAYTLEVYRVDLAGPVAEAAVTAAPENRWIIPDEVHSGTTADGHRVSPTVSLILSRLDLPCSPKGTADVAERP